MKAVEIDAGEPAVRWRLIDLAALIWETFGISVSEATLSRELKALGYSKLSARPRHHAQNEERIAAFKNVWPAPSAS
jgi:transposase